MIDTDQKLAGYLPTVRAAQWLALDTEADSLHAYPEKLCLIQISTVAGDELIDPLAGVCLDPLLEALGGHELLMHGADYDLRLLSRHHRFVPGVIFDTMLAARLLGEKQFGLGHLVEKYLGVKLDKGSQKADWARRPLTERMAQYARNDTRHLKPLRDPLKQALEARGRLGWHREMCARLIVDSSRPVVADPEQVWRVKGCHGLGRPALAVVRELWHWRENEAVAANKPPFFVLSHEALVTLALAAVHHKPVDPLLPPRLSARRREGVATAIRTALHLPPEQFPALPERTSRRRPTPSEFRRYRELERRRDTHAHQLGIDPTLIAPRAALGDLARDWDRHAPELMSWQRDLLK